MKPDPPPTLVFSFSPLSGPNMKGKGKGEGAADFILGRYLEITTLTTAGDICLTDSIANLSYSFEFMLVFPSIMPLAREFYNRKTVRVAKDLIGKYLVRRMGDRIVAGMIIETEAYCGPDDLACHASKGKTPRTEVMFG